MVPILMLPWQHARLQSPASPKLHITNWRLNKGKYLGKLGRETLKENWPWIPAESKTHFTLGVSHQHQDL